MQHADRVFSLSKEQLCSELFERLIQLDLVAVKKCLSYHFHLSFHVKLRSEFQITLQYLTRKLKLTDQAGNMVLVTQHTQPQVT